MKVVLLREVEGVGKPGDIVNVAPGYARNFLIPREMAVPGTEGRLADANKRIANIAKREAGKRTDAEGLATRMNAIHVKIKAKVGEGTRLYGSVTNKDIQEALQKAGISIDRRKIELKEHVRSLGTFQVPVRLHKDLVGTFTLEVVPE